jgi:ATP-dependent Lon protease
MKTKREDDGRSVRELPVLPLRNLVLFPGVVLPVDVGRASSVRLIEEVVARQPSRLLLATQRDSQVEDPKPEQLHDVGVEAEILKVVKLGEGRLTVVIRGLERRRFGKFTRTEPYLSAEAISIDDVVGNPVEVEGLAMAVRDTAKQVIELSPEIPDEAAQVVDQIRDPGRLADLAAANAELSVDERIALLAEADVAARLRKVLGHLQHRVEVFRVKEKIDTQVREQFSKHQREAVLRQKLKAIQDELGEMGEGEEDVSELEEKLQKAGMPEDVHKIAQKQLARLKGMPAASAEYTVTRTYLEWLLDLPWSKVTEDKLELTRAREILDQDHYDLEKVKKRIIEYLAVRKLAPQKKGPILCLAGPPGVGKTSLGKSIARALGREFVRVSLGGVRDEAEIRGHRRTYIGALPGRIIQGMKRAGTRNPVFMLDEIDKLGADFRGDPSAALLEVLDPEQNNQFSDHYLEVSFDLSQVIFIATANYLEPVPPALRDRMEILELPGYTRLEKLAIAKSFLVPKQIGEHGLTEHHIQLSDETIGEIIERYTREAGVRNLEREIANVVRAIAVRVAAGESYSTAVTAGDLAGLLGPGKYFPETSERTEIPGVATGLAWTPTGGEILFIEASQMPGKGNLVMTGQLGGVMKESGQAALSWVRSRAKQLAIRPDFFEKLDIHVHVPAGAIPKDGPSAGTALCAALVSLLTGRCVRSDVAMTGEITLRGSILPVGGIKEKVLAAHRAGLRRVVLPERNQKDVADVPEEIRTSMQLLFVHRIDELLELTLEPVAVVTPEVLETAPQTLPPPSPA